MAHVTSAQAFADVEQAWHQARQQAEAQDIILVCGSFLTVAQVMESIETEKGRGE